MRVALRVMLATGSAVLVVLLGIVVAMIAAACSTPPVYSSAVTVPGDGIVSIEYIFLSVLLTVPAGIAGGWAILRRGESAMRDRAQANPGPGPFFWGYILCTAKNTTGEFHDGR